jgi:integrase
MDLGPAPEVFFNKSLQEVKGALRVKEPKTPKGRRRAPIAAATATRLRAIHTPSSASTEGLVFPAEGGGFIRRSNFRSRVWLPLQKKAGLSAFRFHDLRHTCATALLLANVHPKVVSERLGHSKIEVTLNTYSHLLPTMQTSAVAALEGLLLQPQ